MAVAAAQGRAAQAQVLRLSHRRCFGRRMPAPPQDRRGVHLVHVSVARLMLDVEAPLTVGTMHCLSIS